MRVYSSWWQLYKTQQLNKIYMTIIEDIKIKCPDNIELAATLFVPQNLKGAVMIGPATGIKRKFYHSFATFLADNNYGVITFDNRGIGNSLIGNIKNSNATLQSWGEKDMTSALNTLKEKFPSTKYHLIGHSAGGQLVGLMKNCKELSSMFNFASSSGSLYGMKYPYKFKALFFLNIFIPLNNLLFGYTNTQWLGMGEPLPKMVAKQWQKWCNGQGYVKSDFGDSIKEHNYDDLKFPTFWLNSSDDDIANDKNVADMISVFPNIKASIQTLNPLEYELNDIGHMKFFSRGSEKLWTLAKDWLDKN